jgi:hypothetical protein
MASSGVVFRSLEYASQADANVHYSKNSDDKPECRTDNPERRLLTLATGGRRADELDSSARIAS